MTYADAARWFVCVTLVVGLGLGFALSGENRLSDALGGWGGLLILAAIPPVIAALCAAPRMRLSVYLVNGVPGVIILALVVAFAFPEPYEPIFARSFVAVLFGGAMLIGLGLGALPIILWRKLRARSRLR